MIVLIIIHVIFLVYILVGMTVEPYQAMALINKVFFMSTDPPVFNPNDFEWSSLFRSDSHVILDEYKAYTLNHFVPSHCAINSHVAMCDPNHLWQTLYLRAYCIDTDLSKHFPLTMNLINRSPCTLAFFSILKPRAKLTSHVGPYKGVIRYHLGLIVPTDWTNCFINVAGQTLHWKEGLDLMFDDTFDHYVENNTDEMRVILFLDIKRDFGDKFINQLNDEFLKVIKSNDTLTDTISNINFFANHF
jgi:aspartyl/asparaginyl beta-hydroxylase (cupin superfamily)